jgi:hypothetical protein
MLERGSRGREWHLYWPGGGEEKDSDGEQGQEEGWGEIPSL